jgi:hypothetical protein
MVRRRQGIGHPADILAGMAGFPFIEQNGQACHPVRQQFAGEQGCSYPVEKYLAIDHFALALKAMSLRASI